MPRVRRKAQNLHTVVVERVRLAKIEHVESYCMAFPRVGTPEEIPLRMSIRVNIVLKD